MSTLKVWCDVCEGSGVLADLSDCPACCDGYIEREVVELPDGRAVVVTREAWKRFMEAMDAAVEPLEKNGAIAEHLLTALFTSGVYEAEAVGYLVDSWCVPEGGGNKVDFDRTRDLIAIGLKEVGRGKA